MPYTEAAEASSHQATDLEDVSGKKAVLLDAFWAAEIVPPSRDEAESGAWIGDEIAE